MYEHVQSVLVDAVIYTCLCLLAWYPLWFWCVVGRVHTRNAAVAPTPCMQRRDVACRTHPSQPFTAVPHKCNDQLKIENTV